MALDVPLIFIAGFLVFFMGGFFFTYYTILWFEDESRKEDEKLGRVIKLPGRSGEKPFSAHSEELSERKKVA